MTQRQDWGAGGSRRGREDCRGSRRSSVASDADAAAQGEGAQTEAGSEAGLQREGDM